MCIYNVNTLMAVCIPRHAPGSFLTVLSSQFQKEYPDIYSRRFPTTESEAQLFAEKPKIKPPMLIGVRKAKAFSIRN